ncbi:MAG: thioredoxin-like domain-containing protein [Fimbriimonadales bacterium]|nr:thioredoxin-like domain-containing protein [Fimbriimonadales bacterium]
MRTLWGLTILILLNSLWAQDSLPPATLTLRVVDAEGKPIAGAQVGGVLLDYRRMLVLPAAEPFWQATDSQGMCALRWSEAHEPALREVWHGERRGVIQLLVGASGYQAHLLELTYPAPNEHTVTLQPAQPLEIELNPAHVPPDDFGATPPIREPKPLMAVRGQPIGDLVVVCESPLYARTQLGDKHEWMPSLNWGLLPNFGVERLTPTRYRVWLPADAQPPLALIVNRPDWLWGYLAAVDAESLNQRRLTLDLPRGGSLVVRVDLGQYEGQEMFGRRMVIGRDDAETQGVYALQTIFLEQPTQEIRLENLAPSSEWQLALSLYDRRNPYATQRKFRILPQETRTLAIRYEPFDPNRYKGARQLTLRLMTREGKPAANQPIEVQLYIDEYARSIPVAQGRTDAQGRLRLQNLYELPAPPDNPRYAPRYLVREPGEYETLGEFTLVRGDGQQEVVLMEPLRVGDLAPDIEMTDLRTGQTRRLSEFRGRFVLLDFWATWCMPCHRALEQLHDAVKRMEPAQRERLQIVLLSIDDRSSGVLDFLKRRGWDTLGEPMWAGAGGWDAPPAEVYRVNSIPRQILIDPDGRIAVLDTRESIETLLNALGNAPSTGKSDARAN